MEIQVATTGEQDVAVCQKHTVKTQKHTAKTLPCATHGKDHTGKNCTGNSSLPCADYRAHGKDYRWAPPLLDDDDGR